MGFLISYMSNINLQIPNSVCPISSVKECSIRPDYKISWSIIVSLFKIMTVSHNIYLSITGEAPCE